MNRTLAAFGVVAVLFTACGGEDPYRDELSDDVLGTYRAGLTMSGVGGCDTSVVQGLTDQLVEELNCIAPNAMVNFKGPEVNLYSSVQPFLAPAAATSLKATANAANDYITVSSAYRSLAQQYLLYKWYRAGQCNIQIAAVPGNSNHNGGRAVDIPYYSSWRAGLEAHGFTWYGSGDVVHFDYLSAPTIASKSILAFQKLWNKNHSTPIGEDSQWGPETENAMANTPVTGFSVHGCNTTGKLTGVIYQGGSTSNPVSGATVKVGSDTVTTGTDGKYTFTLAPAAYTVNVSKSGYSSNSVTKTVTAGATTWGSMEINPVATTGVLSGVVFDSASGTGAVLSGATVTVGGQTKTTGSAGTFSFTLQAGSYTLAVTKSGFGSASVSKTVTAGGTTTANVGLTATTTDAAPVVEISSPAAQLVSEFARVTISGTAIDDNDAIAEVSVQLNGDPAVSVPVTSGGFSVDLKLRPGVNTVHVEASDSKAQKGSAEWTGSFRSGVSGVVRRYDQPEAKIVGAKVSLIDGESALVVTSAETDAAGHFDLDVTTVPASYALTVTADGYVSHTETLAIDDEARSQLDIGLTPGATGEASIRFIEPRAGELVTDPEVTVSGVVSGLQLAGVTVNGVDAQLLGNSAFVVRMPMPEGHAVFDVIASSPEGAQVHATVEADRPVSAVKGGCSATGGGALVIGAAMVVAGISRRRKILRVELH